MKSHRNIRFVVLFVLLLSAFSAKAQIDTAYVGEKYINQYIVPHLIDSTLENCYWEEPSLVGQCLTTFYFENPTPCTPENPTGGHPLWSNRIAQRYDTQDSVTLAGIAVLTASFAQNSEGVFVRYLVETRMAITGKCLQKPLLSLCSMKR